MALLSVVGFMKINSWEKHALYLKFYYIYIFNDVSKKICPPDLQKQLTAYSPYLKYGGTLCGLRSFYSMENEWILEYYGKVVYTTLVSLSLTVQTRIGSCRRFSELSFSRVCFHVASRSIKGLQSVFIRALYRNLISFSAWKSWSYDKNFQRKKIISLDINSIKVCEVRPKQFKMLFFVGRQFCLFILRIGL